MSADERRLLEVERDALDRKVKAVEPMVDWCVGEWCRSGKPTSQWPWWVLKAAEAFEASGLQSLNRQGDAIADPLKEER